jgi:uncharacterized protein YbjT (DUF2867 family)
VIVEALTASGLSTDVFELTGGELLSVPEQVAILADVLRKEIHCIDIPVESAVQRMTQMGIPAPIAEGIAQSLQAVRDGRAVMLTDTVKSVTAKKPLTFKAWVEQRAALFE